MPTIDNPILNSPFAEPTRHWRLNENGIPTGEAADGRRRSEYIVPVPPPRHTDNAQTSLRLEEDHGERKSNDYVNELRAKVAAWRNLAESQWQRTVTPVTAQLLRYWRDPERTRRLFFCQIEAVETAIWLAEVAPRAENDRIRALNAEANPDLFRVALKLATGAGKTTVMGMLIAWQTLNHHRSRGSTRFTDAFLVISPGITIRDRLRVLRPSDPYSVYIELDLVPPDLRDALQSARVVITNYHQFKRRETMEAPKLVKSILGGRDGPVKTQETEGMMIARACKDLLERNLLSRKRIIVLNDEAHHCYREKTGANKPIKLTTDDRVLAKKANETARLWISGIEALQRVTHTQVTVYDLSATPFFLRGSGYKEGELFPWVVSDFSLVDAIESGIVKVPRVPIQDLPGADEPVYRHVYRHIKLPTAGRGKQAETLDPETLPSLLTGALTALYGHYARVFAAWDARGGGTPPVFIVVCNNTSTSKLVFDHIAGYTRAEGDREIVVAGKLELLSNVDDRGSSDTRRFLSRPRTILIDSEQLESGETLSDDFRRIAAPEIDAFKRELRQRGRHEEAETIAEADLLREVMNTVGQPGRLGEQIRCVVSVSMLTEGWDARTVTHILGVRAFGTQLLCEQVIGRALRRVSYDPVSYDVNGNGMFAPEYADVLGIPFSFIPANSKADYQPPKKMTQIHAVLPEREALTIDFPRVTGYRTVLPPARLSAKFSEESRLIITPADAPPTAINAAIVGQDVVLSLDDLRRHRDSTIAFHVAGHTLRSQFRDAEGALKPWLFPALLAITRDWMRDHLSCIGNTFPAYLLWRDQADKAAERIFRACQEASGQTGELHPILDPYNEVGSSKSIRFSTTKTNLWSPNPAKCQTNLMVADSDWEVACAQILEEMPEVLRYIRNDRLGFEVPYVDAGATRRYRPDFIAMVDGGASDPMHLILEVKGEKDGSDAAKHDTMRSLWVPAVNNATRFGQWDFLMLDGPYDIATPIRRLIATNAQNRAT